MTRLFRNARAMIENLFDPQSIVPGGLAAAPAVSGLLSPRFGQMFASDRAHPAADALAKGVAA